RTRPEVLADETVVAPPKEFGQVRLHDLGSRFTQGDPFATALLPLRPMRQHTDRFDGEHIDRAMDCGSAGEHFLVAVAAYRMVVATTPHARFLEGLLQGRLRGRFALHRPAFREQPVA